MNKSEEFEEDLLNRYINPEKIKKAPIGFTERIMTRIQAEKVPFASRKRTINNYKVPIISGLITVALIISAILVSSTGNDSTILSVLKPFSDIRIAFPEINFGKFTDFTLPEWMIYIALGIFMLYLFDLALNIIFHKERK